MDIKISPSILSADFANLGQEVKLITKCGADYIHIDVMDGHFVPNITIGADVLAALKKYSDKPFDVHLMVTNPQEFIEDFAKAGADIITMHQETVTHLDRCIDQIHKAGCKAGVSIVPSTPPEVLDYVIDKLDMVLIMSVNPGFGGQKFIPKMLDKIRELRYMIDESGKDIDLSVDGGVSTENISEIIDAGANVIVAGSAIFNGGAQNYAQNILNLRGDKVVPLK